MALENLPEYKHKIQQSIAEGSCRGVCVSDCDLTWCFTIRVPTFTAFYFVAEDEVSFCYAARLAWQMEIPWKIVGAGSNLIPPDYGFDGVILSARRLREVSVQNETVTVGCGCYLQDLLLCLARAGLSGMESLYGIPGTVGGAIRMNAGAHGCAVSDCLLSARVFDAGTGKCTYMTVAELRPSYRSTILQSHAGYVVLSADFRLRGGLLSADLHRRIADVTKKRLRSQPIGEPSAGSVFRRPTPDMEVWRLVDACRLRGAAYGGAQISEKHAGFFINRGNATARDMRWLLFLVQKRVWDVCHVALMPEVEFF